MFQASANGGHHPDAELSLTPALTLSQRHAWLLRRGVFVLSKALVAVRANTCKEVRLRGQMYARSSTCCSLVCKLVGLPALIAAHGHNCNSLTALVATRSRPCQLPAPTGVVINLFPPYFSCYLELSIYRYRYSFSVRCSPQFVSTVL